MQTGDGDPASSLVFSVVLVHSNSLGLEPGLATDTVPAAQLGLALAPGCHAVLAAAEGGAAQLEASASKKSIRRFVITEKAPTRAFSWLKAATTAFTFKTLC